MKFIKYTVLYLIFATLAIQATAPTQQFYDKDYIVVLNEQSDLQNLLQSNIGPCVIYFYMNNCGWCSKMSPIIESLAQDPQFLHHITFYKVNGPQTQAATLVQQYLNQKITGYPTLYFMNQGQLVDKQIGGTTQNIMTQKLTALLTASENN